MSRVCKSSILVVERPVGGRRGRDLWTGAANKPSFGTNCHGGQDRTPQVGHSAVVCCIR